MGEPGDVEVICGCVQDRCICVLGAHDEHAPHECECGGSWRIPEGGGFEIINLPGPFGGGRTIPRFPVEGPPIRANRSLVRFMRPPTFDGSD